LFSAVIAAAATLGLLQEQPPDAYRPSLDALGHESPAVREAAARHLRAAGRAAWPALDEAARSHPDPETRGRAADLLHASRLRRRLPYSLLEEHPGAVATLSAGATAEKIRLVRALGRRFEETSDLLLDLVRDPDPEVALAAAEVLHENRNADWGPRLLEIYALEECPRAGRVFELLCAAASRLGADEVQRRLADCGPRARNRFLHLALQANVALAVPPATLREMLRHGDTASRRAALAWMRDRGAPGTLFEIEPLLSHAEAPVVAEALATLRHLRHRPDPDALEALLRHDEALVREEAVMAVVAFEERACLSSLRRLLGDPSTAVRQGALSALWKLEGVAALDTVLEVFLRDAGDSRGQALSLLATHKEWSLPRVRDLVRDADPDRRQRAFELLAQVEGVAALAPLVRDRDETVRRWALGQFLRRTEAPATLEAVEGFARDASEPIRFEAVRTLVRLGKREHVPALQGFLASPEYTLRHEAAETLLEQGGAPAETLARKLLNEDDAPLRRLALNALAGMGDRASADRAMAHLADADGRLRRAAAEYLRKLLSAGRDPSILARLASGLETLDEEPLALAFRLIVEHGDATAADAVRKLVLSGRAPSPERAVRALSEWAGDRAAAELAPLLGREPVLDELVYARVRECRRKTPGAGKAELEAALRKLMGSPDRRTRRSAAAAAEELGAATDLLPSLVADPDPAVRHVAVAACARLGLASAAGAIDARRDDEDPDVRVACVTALLKLRPASAAALRRAAAEEDCAWARRRMDAVLAAASK
jgi:HEAT repeat protein